MKYDKTHLHIWLVAFAFAILPLVFFAEFNYYYVLIAISLHIIFVGLGQSAGNHRYWSHKSFKTNRLGEHLMLWPAIFGLQAHPIDWMANHNAHHQYSDTDKDPIRHPTLNPIKMVWNIHGPGYTDGHMSRQVLKKLVSDKVLRFTYEYYTPIILSYVFILFLISPTLVLWAWAIPACTAITMNVGVTYWNHKPNILDIGYRNYEINDQSVNIGGWLYCLWTMGEGLHNNHHANPRDWNQAKRKGEIDPTAWLISILKTT